jgi:hypothetical protein
MDEHPLRLKAYTVVVSQDDDKNHSLAIARALSAGGFDNCISSTERDLELGIATGGVVKRPRRNARDCLRALSRAAGLFLAAGLQALGPDLPDIF